MVSIVQRKEDCMAPHEHKKNGEPSAATNHERRSKDYTSPELIEYGDVAELTKTLTNAGIE